MRRFIARVIWSTFCLLLLTFVGTAWAEPMSTAMAILYSSLIGSGAGLGASWLGSKNKQKGGITGPQVVTMPQYSFTEPRLKLTSDFISQNIERMMQGDAPQYWEKAKPQITGGMRRGLDKAFFGGGGFGGGGAGGSWGPGLKTGPSIMDSVRSAGAATGVGPKATMAGTERALASYAEGSAKIDEFIASKTAEIAQSGASTFPQLSSMMPKGPDAQVLGGMPFSQPQKPDYMTPIMQNLGKALPTIMQQMGGGAPPVDMSGVPNADYLNMSLTGGAGEMDPRYSSDYWNNYDAMDPSGYSWPGGSGAGANVQAPTSAGFQAGQVANRGVDWMGQNASTWGGPMGSMYEAGKGAWDYATKGGVQDTIDWAKQFYQGYTNQ